MRLRQRIVLTLVAIVVVMAIPAAYALVSLSSVHRIARDLKLRDTEATSTPDPGNPPSRGTGYRVSHRRAPPWRFRRDAGVRPAVLLLLGSVLLVLLLRRATSRTCS